MTGKTARAIVSAAASECAPQPWSADTTRPSSGAYAFAQAPKTSPSSPLNGTKKPQLRQCAGAACASGDRGPCSLAYQREAAPSRPIAESTRDRPAALGPPPATAPRADLPVGDRVVAFQHHERYQPLVVGRGGHQVPDAE